MPLVKLLQETSDKTLAAAIDYVIAIRKVQIVNDGRGFYQRVFGKYINEGITMLTEGTGRSY
jgi:3-hydroxyacyl-CoA dehydrogenase/enoyl-CoA hydratase/3-hydroxybutyryl-CoA epimerase